MKTNWLAQVTLLLWVVTIAVLLWLVIRGDTAVGTDGRTAILLQPAERELVLSEMRWLLVATQAVLEGANQGDRSRIIKAARAAGMAGKADVNPSLMARLPLEFKAPGMSVHHDMDEIARAAEDGKPESELLKMTSDTLTKCVDCHVEWQSTWQLKAGV